MGSAYLHTRHLSHEKDREGRERRLHEYKYMTHNERCKTHARNDRGGHTAISESPDDDVSEA